VFRQSGNEREKGCTSVVAIAAIARWPREGHGHGRISQFCSECTIANLRDEGPYLGITKMKPATVSRKETDVRIMPSWSGKTPLGKREMDRNSGL